jgi:integrase
MEVVMSEVLFSDAADLAIQLYKGKDPGFPRRLGFWVERLGDRPLTSIKAGDIEDGIDVLVNKPRMVLRRNEGLVDSGRAITGSTVNRYCATIGTMYLVLATARRLPRGLVSPAKGVKKLPEGEARTLTVSVADVRRLVACARLSRNRKLAALIAVGCTTGLRMGSMQSITWGDVDIDAGHIDVHTTKNGRPTRSVLPPWAIAELARIRPSRPDDHAPVFGPSNPLKAFRTALDDAGLPAAWTLHHMRHIAASVLAESGAPLPVIMQALNHKTPGMALRYSHVNTHALQGAVARAWK